MRWFVANLQPGFIPGVPEGAVFVATGSGFAIFQVPDQDPPITEQQRRLIGKQVAVYGSDKEGEVISFCTTTQKYTVRFAGDVFGDENEEYRFSELVELHP